MTWALLLAGCLAAFLALWLWSGTGYGWLDVEGPIVFGAIAAWFGFSATGGTPEPIVNLLNAEMRKVLQDPGNRQKLAAQGMDVLDSTPAEFAAYIRSEIDLWGKVVKASGAKVQ